MTDIYRKGQVELRLGDYRDVLVDVHPDAVITDPPYSVRTHSGLRVYVIGDQKRSGLIYEHWDERDVEELIAWCSRVPWVVALTDHMLWRAFCRQAERSERYTFPPLPFVEMGKQPRMTGDGPASWTCQIAVSRLAERSVYRGSLPGAYVLHTHERRDLKGGKPLSLMRALVRDYSDPGALVCDPCAGAATTLIAAALEGRRAIGAEIDRKTYELACNRIERTALTLPLALDEGRDTVAP